MNRPIVTHEIDPKCATGIAMASRADTMNHPYLSAVEQVGGLYDQTGVRVTRFMQGSPVVSRVEAKLSSAREELVNKGTELAKSRLRRAVCPLAGQSACAGACKAEIVPAFPELQK